MEQMDGTGKKEQRKEGKFNFERNEKCLQKENIQNCKYFEVVEKYGAILFDFHC